MTLRVNTAKASRDHYLALLAEAAIGARPASFAATGIYLENPVAVDQLPGFADGWVSVQDEASQLCAPLLHPMPGHRVLDACCAPGGKTCHILETEPGLSELVALDIDAGRLDKVRQNLSRLNLSATITAADASDLGAWWDGRPFDRILLDAPCSATGVIRRHPDIKLLRTPADIDKLGEIQHKLLSTLWATLKPGGKLLYTTCSVLPEENDQVIATFLQNKGDCLPQPLSLVTGIATPYGHQLLPCPNGNDGFYYSLLQKTGATPGESS
jgi:16S rRNA (cytosine967-C5)-methyltransferase